ncbi:phosphonopyruvate decarboxylase [Seinonella peptonophila]|uniref:Phosphonopyruvate decarboxylase n=1 Tax=Seinonella peptonophila TaxID=112248 RepID=A0A1M5BAU1_9BACL|nr:phosphonopyruvate decarboxylase [Seinonella peptonophila]SHF39526.1 phosphonopyruvate decarboxylase [Seinonella peptonophila]
MLDTQAFGHELRQLGYTFYTGVPCSFLKDLLNYAINECEYIIASNEGEAIAIASGASIGGKKAVVFMQNSGLTNAVSPLTSLNYPFQIPLLGFVSLRGEPTAADEPQHELMGQITTNLLTLMRVKWSYLSTDLETAKQQIQQANAWIDQNHSFFFVVRKGTFAPQLLQETPFPIPSNQTKVSKQTQDQLPSRFEALTSIHSLKNKHTILITTTGKTGRELYQIADDENHLYMVGSMGCASSLGLGIALSQPRLKVIVVDGDGSLLMRLGNLATIGCYQPPNLLHILLDNQVHDSTGGQSTVSPSVNFVEMAAACSYPRSIYLHHLHELSSTIQHWSESSTLTFLYLKIRKGSQTNLSRPHLKPHEVKTRLQSFIRQALTK